jgi:hypothetical protein
VPVALRRLGGLGGRIPVLGDALHLGSEADVVVADRRVRPRHARLRYQKGEWLLSADGDAAVWVNGSRASILPLRPGDRIELLEPGLAPETAFAFEDALAGAFVPPGTSRWAAWLALGGAKGASAVLAAHGIDAPPEGVGPSRLEGREPSGAARRVHLGPLETSVDAALAAVAGAAALAAAPHWAVAHVLDAGVLWAPAGARAFAVTEPAAATRGDAPEVGPPPSLGHGVREVADLARGLAWLHQRGLVASPITPDAVGVAPGGRARLESPLALSPRIRSAEGPARDVRDLCRYAAARLGRACEAAPEVAACLAAGRADDPADRPTAADLARRLEGWLGVRGLEA